MVTLMLWKATRSLRVDTWGSADRFQRMLYMKLSRPLSNLAVSSRSRWHSFNVLRKSPQIWRRDFKSQVWSSRDNVTGTCLVTSPITWPSFWRFLAKCWISAPNSAYCFAEQDHSKLARALTTPSTYPMEVIVDAFLRLVGRKMPWRSRRHTNLRSLLGKTPVPKAATLFYRAWGYQLHWHRRTWWRWETGLRGKEGEKTEVTSVCDSTARLWAGIYRVGPEWYPLCIMAM